MGYCRRRKRTFGTTKIPKENENKKKGATTRRERKKGQRRAAHFVVTLVFHSPIVLRGRGHHLSSTNALSLYPYSLSLFPCRSDITSSCSPTTLSLYHLGPGDFVLTLTTLHRIGASPSAASIWTQQLTPPPLLQRD